MPRSEIAGLSLGAVATTKPCPGDDIEGVPGVRADVEPNSEEIAPDTMIRFERLERQVALSIELGDGSKRFDVRMRIVLTRCKTACFVVATRDEIANDARVASLIPRSS